jgi:DNA-directed RNA polymerase specialized sigma24 family protein
MDFLSTMELDGCFLHPAGLFFEVRWLQGRSTSGMANGPTFEELATPLFGQLYDYAHWLTRDGSEAEDLVQETYLKAFRGFGSFSAGTNFRAWIYRILRNTFLTSRTGLRAAPQISIDDDPMSTNSSAITARPRPSFWGASLLTRCAARSKSFRCRSARCCCSVMWRP